MDFKVIKSETNTLEIDFKEFDQSILNLVKTELWNDSATKLAGFKVTHPQAGIAHFVLNTSGNKQAKTVWNDAVKRASEANDKLAKEFAKL